MKCTVAAIGTLTFLSICSSGALGAPPQVSPDGKWIASVLVEDKTRAIGPEPVVVQQKASICWGPVTDGARVKRLTLGTWGQDKHGFQLDRRVHFAFSPESNWLAVVSPFGLKFIELATGYYQGYDLKDEKVTSLCWLDEETVGYATVPTQEPQREGRSFWRHRRGEANRSQIYRDDSYSSSRLASPEGWPQEFWSPDGRHVLMCMTPVGGPAHLLSVSTGSRRALERDVGLVSASWNRAGTQVFWISHWLDIGQNKEGFRAYLLDVRTDEVTDLTSSLQELRRGTQSYSFPRLEQLWTPDDAFIVGAGFGVGGYLIQPNPWHVRLLGIKLDRTGGRHPSDIRGQPAVGFLTADVHPEDVITDYEGNIVKELPGGGYLSWIVLPGGKEAVRIRASKDVAVIRLK
ncbi:MAG: hypothetical protein ACYTAN_01025 [Planctomycetota bacterium]|jgi:hypothetical protein